MPPFRHWGVWLIFLFVQSSFTIVTMDTVPYAVRMNRIYGVCIIDRRHGSHGVLATKLMLVVTMTMMMMMVIMNFITARKIMVLILVVKTIKPKTMLNYIPNGRTRPGRPLKKLLDEASAGLSGPNS